MKDNQKFAFGCLLIAAMFATAIPTATYVFRNKTPEQTEDSALPASEPKPEKISQVYTTLDKGMFRFTDCETRIVCYYRQMGGRRETTMDCVPDSQIPNYFMKAQCGK